jgi:hypothetical protein
MASVVLLAVLVGGCDNFLDVNEDPNAPVSARVDVRLPAVVTQVVHSIYYDDPGQWGSEWVQQTSYNRDSRSYDELQLYEVQDNSPNGSWGNHYSAVLNETRLMMEELNPDDDPAYYGLAQFIHAWTFLHATDLWGPIPFTEALDPGNPTPVYDSQSTVYDGAMQMLDESIALMGTTSLRTPGANDLLFAGDMSRWVKLARHVKARHELRMAYAPGESASDRAQAALSALQGGLTSQSDDMVFDYVGESGGRNPLWRYQDRGLLFVASGLTEDMLKERNDPRLPIMMEPTIRGVEEGQTIYHGHYNTADVEPDSTVSQVGHYFTDEDASVNVATFADAKFTEAEARLITSGAAAADAPYREGIRAIMQKWGVDPADIDTYVNARPDLSTLANPLEEIIREKWLANYLTVEPWNDWRRTGYPQIQPVDGAFVAGIPVRIRTPASELDRNGDNARATGIDPGLNGMLYAGNDVWWGGSPPAGFPVGG